MSRLQKMYMYFRFVDMTLDMASLLCVQCRRRLSSEAIWKTASLRLLRRARSIKRSALGLVGSCLRDYEETWEGDVDVLRWSNERLVSGGKLQVVLVQLNKPCYSILPDLPDPIKAITEKRKDYSEERIIGYTPQDVYKVVADVNSYKQFLPWCKDSLYLRETEQKSMVRLVVGFPPLLETYTALLLADPPNSLRTISTDGRLFSHLENSWQFRRGPDTDTGPTCIVNFWVTFEFRSLIYARLGCIFFDEVARTMAQAFEVRCQAIYGPDHLKSSSNSLKYVRDWLRTARTGHTHARPCESS